MGKSSKRTCGVFVSLLLLAGGAAGEARGQTYPTTAPSPVPTTQTNAYWVYPVPNAPPPPPEHLFDRRHFELALGGQGFTANGHHGNETIGFVTLNFNYYIVDGLSIGLEGGLSPGTWHDHRNRDDNGRDDDRDDSFHLRASEEMTLLRWHFLTTRCCSLYIDGGLGGLHADRSFPSGSRTDNWLAAVGAGLDLRLAKHWYAFIGGRFARISGGDFGARRGSHDAFDGEQYYGGFSFLW